MIFKVNSKDWTVIDENKQATWPINKRGIFLVKSNIFADLQLFFYMSRYNNIPCWLTLDKTDDYAWRTGDKYIEVEFEEAEDD